MDFWQTLFDIIIILFLTLLNGFFVAAEFAIVKVRLTQIVSLEHKGELRARIVRHIITHLDAYLSATQLGITMASLALGWIGEPLVASSFEPLFHRLGIADERIIHGLSFAIAFSFITFVQIILGELGPKWLAIQAPTKIALLIAYPLRLFALIFKPIIYILNKCAGLILSLVGIHPAAESELIHSEEELRLILANEVHGSTTTRNITLNAMDFHHKTARLAMIPRKEIVALSILAPFKENLAIIRDNKYSRYPVFKNTIDDIIGIVHTKDIFKYDKHLQKDFMLDSVIRNTTFLPETATLEQVLTTIQHKKIHMIILADEYGGTAGLITLENVLEELVGNIQDEYDSESPEVIKIRDNEFLIAGNMTTSDVERMLGIELSNMNIRSIGGLLIEELGHIPVIGEQIQKKGIEFTIEKVADKVIETVRIKKI
jgi:CBS domain containing-hemolysin-like protein